MKTVYKIRDKKTGLFRKGGFNLWSTQGKTWSGIGPLKLHLNLLRDAVRYDWELGKHVPLCNVEALIANWEIVPFVLVESEGIEDLTSWLARHPTRST